MKEGLSLAEARRAALAAQGFASPIRAGTADWPRIENAIRQMNLLQIDSVNVIVRSHYLPVFSRVGHYGHETLDARTLRPEERAVFECWAHEASLVPLDLHPMMRWRMLRARNGDGVYGQLDRFAREEKAYLDGVLDFVRQHGPATVSDLPEAGKGTGGWWGWSKGKLALEVLFDHGLVTTAMRQGFERVYDLTERVIPAEILNRPTLPEAEAIRALVDLSARALGVATASDLRDYFRLPLAEARQAVNELVEDGILQPISVEGWKQQAYLHVSARLPEVAGADALLSPFDPLVWERSRTERLFGFNYRLEIYTPAAKRKYGYYVLPFLMGERLVARVCLKADRQAATLRVNAAHREDHADEGETASRLAAELRLMAAWLGLAKIAVGRRGKLNGALRQALK
jgi:hypothetical protein